MNRKTKRFFSIVLVACMLLSLVPLHATESFEDSETILNEKLQESSELETLEDSMQNDVVYTQESLENNISENIKNKAVYQNRMIGNETVPPISGGSGPYFLQVVYVNYERTEYTYGPRIASSTTTRRWYYDNRPEIPSEYELKGWQSSHYHGTNSFLTKSWWTISGSEATALLTTNQYNQTVILNNGEGVYLIYQDTEETSNVPIAPKREDLYSILGNFVNVRCVSEGEGLPHDIKIYSVVGNYNDAVIGEVYKNTDDIYYCEVTLYGETYCNFYGWEQNFGTSVSHTLVTPNETKTILLKYDTANKKWKSAGNENKNTPLATFDVVCKEKITEIPRLEVTKSVIGEDIVRPGDIVKFNIKIENKGNVDFSFAAVSDTLPEGLTFVSATDEPMTTSPYIIWVISNIMPAGSSKDFIITAKVNDDVPAGTNLINIVDACAKLTDGQIDASDTANILVINPIEEITATECLTVKKIFVGLDEVPKNFSINWEEIHGDASNKIVTKVLKADNAINTEIDKANKTITLTWKVPHYHNTGASNPHIATVTENCDVDGYSYNTTVTQSSWKVNGHTLTRLINDNISASTLTITNTYNLINTDVDYRIEWYDKQGNSIKETSYRTGMEDEIVTPTNDDYIIDGYIFDEDDSRNILSKELKENEENVLKLYFYKVIPTVNLHFEKNIDSESDSFEKLKLNKDDSYNFFISLTNQETGEIINGLLDSKDGFRVNNIPIGTYIIEEPNDIWFHFISMALMEPIDGIEFKEENGNYIITIGATVKSGVTANIKVTNKPDEERFYDSKYDIKNLFTLTM